VDAPLDRDQPIDDAFEGWPGRAALIASGRAISSNQ
jgi:hypothetical protein